MRPPVPTRPSLSIVCPVYRAEGIVEELVRQVAAAAGAVTNRFEIVLVNDASPDDSWNLIAKACADDSRVVGVNLSRNFGQHRAITAGLAKAAGDHVIVMDCDLQDDPRYIPDLYRHACDGYDIVYTRKRKRRHSPVRNWLGSRYTGMLNRLIADQSYLDDKGVGNYSILSRRVVDAFLSMRDQHRHYLALLRWLGFESTTIEIDHRERFEGESSYTLVMLVRESLTGITSQSERLLRASIVGGFVFTIAAFIAIVALMIAWMATGFLAGWPSLMAVNLLGIGLVLGSLGIMGLYVGNIFEQSRGRPLYVVQDEINVWEEGEEHDGQYDR